MLLKRHITFGLQVPLSNLPSCDLAPAASSRKAAHLHGSCIQEGEVLVMRRLGTLPAEEPAGGSDQGLAAMFTGPWTRTPSLHRVKFFQWRGRSPTQSSWLRRVRPTVPFVHVDPALGSTPMLLSLPWIGTIKLHWSGTFTD